MSKKYISWNVNGLRACLDKGFMDFLIRLMPMRYAFRRLSFRRDSLHGTSRAIMHTGTMPKRKGYSGTAIFSKEEPLSVSYDMGIEEHDNEGRIIALEYADYYLVTVYTPNSQRGLERLDYRMKWEDDFRVYLNKLRENKPVIVCGDMNVAHKEIDLKNPKSNRKNAGFTDEERGKMTELLDSGFIDTFRYFYPDVTDRYSWWSYMFHARENNAGWRIDYFLVSEELKDRLVSADIHHSVMGSDHCPVELVIK